jgi:hypothetical protein
MLVAGLLYATWIGMLATHELGHCMHAWLSGGRVVRVSIPPLGFSQTIVHPNPHELWVVWGRPVWGMVLPAVMWIAGSLLPLPADRRGARGIMRFFAGFCLMPTAHISVSDGSGAPATAAICCDWAFRGTSWSHSAFSAWLPVWRCGIASRG